MTLTIELPPDLERRLRHEAAQHGVSLGEYARRLIERQLLPEAAAGGSLWDTLTPEEWARAFDEYLGSHDPAKPPLPPEALERASFYGERA